MAAPGDLKYKYNRIYICVNPDPASGPPTWRLAVPQEPGEGGGGGGGSGEFDFIGNLPIEVTSEPSFTPGKTDVTTSMDIDQLDSRN